MELLIGLVIIVLLAAGIYARRRQKKVWVAEERYDESGAWIDKRAGERGTYGSLDAEMERGRMAIAHKSRVIELTRLIRTFAFENIPAFAEKNDAAINAYNETAREIASQLLNSLEKGQLPPAPATNRLQDDLSEALKKQLLDFAYQAFPALLERELEWIRELDARLASVACYLVDLVDS